MCRDVIQTITLLRTKFQRECLRERFYLLSKSCVSFSYGNLIKSSRGPLYGWKLTFKNDAKSAEIKHCDTGDLISLIKILIEKEILAFWFGGCYKFKCKFKLTRNRNFSLLAEVSEC